MNFTNVSKICELRPLVSTAAQIVALKYVFPFQFVVGFFGNILNLLVLRSMAMRRKTTVLLMCMAAADLLFLVARLPISLAVFDAFGYWNAFREFYYEIYPYQLFAANWMSAASIWFALAVTIERTIAIRSPLVALHIVWRMIYFRLLTLGIVVVSFLSAVHYLFWYKFVTKEECQNSTLVQKALKPLSSNKKLIDTAILLRAFLVVAAPLVVMLMLNTVLTYYIHKYRKHRGNMRGESSRRRRQGASSAQSAERKVTIIVWLIVFSFILLNLPSTIMHLWNVVGGKGAKPGWHRTAVNVTNSLVTTGKAINFILYCIVSEQFRKKAKMALFYFHLCPERDQRSAMESAPTSDRILRKNTVNSPSPGRLGENANAASFPCLELVEGRETDPLNGGHKYHNRVLTSNSGFLNKNCYGESVL